MAAAMSVANGLILFSIMQQVTAWPAGGIWAHTQSQDDGRGQNQGGFRFRAEPRRVNGNLDNVFDRYQKHLGGFINRFRPRPPERGQSESGDPSLNLAAGALAAGALNVGGNLMDAYRNALHRAAAVETKVDVDEAPQTSPTEKLSSNHLWAIHRSPEKSEAPARKAPAHFDIADFRSQHRSRPSLAAEYKQAETMSPESAAARLGAPAHQRPSLASVYRDTLMSSSATATTQPDLQPLPQIKAFDAAFSHSSPESAPEAPPSQGTIRNGRWYMPSSVFANNGAAQPMANSFAAIPAKSSGLGGTFGDQLATMPALDGQPTSGSSVFSDDVEDPAVNADGMVNLNVPPASGDLYSSPVSHQHHGKDAIMAKLHEVQRKLLAIRHKRHPQEPMPAAVPDDSPPAPVVKPPPPTAKPVEARKSLWDTKFERPTEAPTAVVPPPAAVASDVDDPAESDGMLPPAPPAGPASVPQPAVSAPHSEMVSSAGKKNKGKAAPKVSASSEALSASVKALMANPVKPGSKSPFSFPDIPAIGGKVDLLAPPTHKEAAPAQTPLASVPMIPLSAQEFPEKAAPALTTTTSTTAKPLAATVAVEPVHALAQDFSPVDLPRTMNWHDAGEKAEVPAPAPVKAAQALDAPLTPLPADSDPETSDAASADSADVDPDSPESFADDEANLDQLEHQVDDFESQQRTALADAAGGMGLADDA